MNEALCDLEEITVGFVRHEVTRKVLLGAGRDLLAGRCNVKWIADEFAGCFVSYL